jgi:hypothetical protein
MHLTSVVPILLAYVFALTKLRRAFGSGAAGIFVLLSTLMPGALTYNVEVRMYSWAFLFVTMSFWYGYEILSKPTGFAWFMFAVNGLLAAYTHYYALVPVAIVTLGVFAALTARSRRNIRPCLICGVAMIAGYAPWINTLLGAFGRSVENWWSTRIPSVQQCINFLFGTTGSYHWIMWIILAPAAVFLLSGVIRLSAKRQDGILMIEPRWRSFRVQLQNPEFVWFAIGALAIIGTVAVGEALSYIYRPLFLVRYLFPVTGILWLLPAVSIAKVPVPYRRLISLVLASAILILGMKSWVSQYTDDLNADVKTNETIESMSGQLDDSDILVTDIDLLSWTVLKYYFPGNKVLNLRDADWASLSQGRVWLYLADSISQRQADELASINATVEYVREGALATHSYHLYRVTFPEQS